MLGIGSTMEVASLPELTSHVVLEIKSKLEIVLTEQAINAQLVT